MWVRVWLHKRLTQEAGPVPVTPMWLEHAVGAHGRVRKVQMCLDSCTSELARQGMGSRIAGFWRSGIPLPPAHFPNLPSRYHQFCLSAPPPRDDKGLAGKQSKLSRAIKIQRVIVWAPRCSLRCRCCGDLGGGTLRSVPGLQEELSAPSHN